MLDTNPKKMYLRDYRELLLGNCALFASREQFKQVRGVEPPPYDPSRRTKRWMLAELTPGLLNGRFNAKVLAEDPDTGEILRSLGGKPFLIDYSFSYDSALQVNIPLGIAGEKRFEGPDAWLPLREMAETERLEFREDLHDAPAGPFYDCKVFLVDDAYKPVKPVDLLTVWNKLVEVQKQLDELRLKVEFANVALQGLSAALKRLEDLWKD